MNSLVALTLLSLQMGGRRNEILRSIALQYFNQSNSLTIFKDMKTEWNIYPFPFPITIFDIRLNFNITLQSSVLLLHISKLSLSELLINKVKWNSDTKFLVVTENGCSDEIVTYLWHRQACQLLVVSIMNERFQICSDRTKRCPYDQPRALPNIYSSKRQFSDYILQPILKDCTLKISLIDLPPYVELNEGRTLFGNEGEIIRMALTNLGATMTFKSRGKNNWGNFDPPSGLIGDVSTGHSFLGVGGMFPFLERHLKGTMVQFCLPVHIGFIVPKGAGRNSYSTLLFLTSEFAPEVWLIFILIYFLLIPVTCCINSLVCILQKRKSNTTNWPLTIFQLILGVPTQQLYSKIMMISCILYGFLLMTMYKSALSSKLAAPLKVPEITTRNELRDSGLSIAGRINTRLILQEMGEFDSVIKDLVVRHEINNEDSINLLKKLVERRNFGIFRYTLEILQLKLAYPELVDRIHVVEEKGSEFFSFALLKKGTCFRRTLIRKFSQICEGGLVSKSLKDVSEIRNQVANSNRRPRILVVADIQGLLLLTVVGELCAIAAFLVELVWFYVKKESFVGIKNQ